MKASSWFIPTLAICLLCRASSAKPFLEPVATSQHEVALHWSDINPDAAQLKLYRDDTLLGEFKANTRSFRDTQLKPGQRYIYKLSEVFSGGKEESVTEPIYTIHSVVSSRRYQLVVVGGTASGVGAAIAAARNGIQVAIIEPSDRLGGMIVSGVSVTDMRKPARSNGLFEEFRQRVQAYYGTGNGMSYEPKVSWKIIRNMVDELPTINVYTRMAYRSAEKTNRMVTSVTCRDNTTGKSTVFYADQFIDATIEGDMMNALGVANRVGREARSKEEPHAGFIHYDRINDVLMPGSTGKADKKLQAYSFPLALKDYGEGADKSIAKPPYYDKDNYIHTSDWKKTWAYMYGRFPGGKFEMNQHPQGNDLQEINHNYCWMTDKQRADMTDRFKWHALGYLYYLQTEQGLKQLGLADDEYPENNNIPTSLYVREARRMEGSFMLNESDVSEARQRIRKDSIGVGDYPMDSHAVHKKTDWTTDDLGEGEYWLYRQTPWYQIPLGVIVPKELDNLLVTSAVSATHVGYGTLRLEPVRMLMGQAAGMMASLSIGTSMKPSDVSTDQLQRRLISDGVYMSWFSDVTAETPRFWAIQGLAAKAIVTDEVAQPNAPLSYEYLINTLYKALSMGYEKNPRGYYQPVDQPFAQQEYQISAVLQHAMVKADSYTKDNLAPIMQLVCTTKGLSAKATTWALSPIQSASDSINREQFLASLELILRGTNSGVPTLAK